MTSGGKRLRVIAIDGPAAAGKTTVARALADRTRATFLDTGLLYRAITLTALERGVSITDRSALAALAESIDLRLRPPSVADGRLIDVLVDDIDVTSRLREPAIDRSVSAVSANHEVRSALLPIQRSLAAAGPIVMAGRDIATVVFPDAGIKIYLDAGVEERARRRYDELAAKGKPLPYDVVLADLERRDAIDSSRDIAPLTVDSEAIVVNTDGLTIEEVVDHLEAIVTSQWEAGD
jgi:cytidylate kinase